MPALNHGLLWSIQSTNGITSFVLGTIHMDSIYFRKHRQVFGELLKRCNAFAAEVNLRELSSLSHDHFLSTDTSKCWLHNLSHRKRLKLNRWCISTFHASLEDFGNLPPLMVLHALTLKLLNDDHSKSIDQSLWDMAEERGLECFGMESFQQHFDALDSYPIRDQLKLLVSFLKNTKNEKSRLFRLIKQYENGNIAYLYRESKRSLGKNRHHMLYHRNQIMVNKMIEDLDSKAVFYACGAAHLYGFQGILSILKRNGYKLQPIDPNLVIV